MQINLSIDLTSLAFWSGVPSTVFLLRYAFKVFVRQAPPTGTASFMMWSILDMLLLINTIRNGQPIWLPFGWVLGAAVTTLVLCYRGGWSWTQRETISLIGAVIAATVSVLAGGRWGLIASIMAMMTASVPITIDNWRVPVRETFMLWFVTVIGCMISLAGSDWSFDGTVLAWSSLVYNGMMALIVLRKPNKMAVPCPS